MRIQFAVVVLAFAVSGTPAHAIDCSKASTSIERRICANSSLQSADDAMGAAYSRLLHGITDADIRTSLINSQRRWLAARERDLGNLGKGDDALDDKQQLAVLISATRERSNNLTKQSAGQPQFVADAMKQQKFVAAYTGGAFAGYRTSCSFIRDRRDQTSYSYNCFGSHTTQNGNRLCTSMQDFASYSSVETRSVAVVEDGKAKTIATCTVGEGQDVCPDVSGDSSKGAHWNVKPVADKADGTSSNLSLTKVDPELREDSDDQDWLRACLTDPSFPLAAPAANRSNGN